MNRRLLAIAALVFAGVQQPAAGLAQSSVSNGAADGPTVLRPSTSPLVYRADALGHFLLSGAVNGTPVRFLVDTGASLVFLSPADARAAGVDPAGLTFDQWVQTAQGRVRAAPMLLRQVRLDQLVVDNVRAAVIESLPQSVLGMSFLNRLKRFEIREGALTINR